MFKPNIFLASAVSLLASVFSLNALSHGAVEPDFPYGAETHAPIGVMGDHNHKTGEWMLAYRFRQMRGDGLLDGSDSLSDAEVFARGYMVAPQEMTMDMHMFGGMYGVSDDLTMTLMLPWMEKRGRNLRANGQRFTTETAGWGDLKINGLYTLYLDPATHSKTILKLGVSLPTGKINHKDDTPMGANMQMGYGMQMGSGTFDLTPGLTHNHFGENWNWGVQAGAVIHLGENYRGYALGDSGHLSGWLVKPFSSAWSASLRLQASYQESVEGRDKQLNPRMNPSLDPDNYGGKKLDAFVGVNYFVPSGRFKGHRLALELGAPLYQKLNGPQMQNRSTLTAGWQYAWK